VLNADDVGWIAAEEKKEEAESESSAEADEASAEVALGDERSQ
jgi:hypothetical protein